MASENENSRDAMPLRDNYFYRHLFRWRKIHLAVTCGSHNEAQDEETSRHLLSAILGANICTSSVPATFMNFFSEYMARAENDLKACLKTYMPDELQTQLLPLSDVVKMDPLDALKELVKDAPTDDAKKRFEILRLLELTIEYAHLANQVGLADPKPASEIEKNWMDFEQNRITVFLMSLGLGVKIEARNLIVYLNPKRRWSCHKICWEEEDKRYRETLLARGLVRIVKPVYAIAKDNPEKTVGANALVVRRQRHRVKKDLIYAVIQTRQKGCFEAFAKRFRGTQGQFSFPSDLFGFRIACFSKREMEIWSEFFNLITFHKRRGVRKVALRNRNAARKLRLFSHPIFLSGKTRELQYIHLKDLMNVLHSTREENHTLYHLRWYSEKDGLFEQLWPTELYGVNWQDAGIRERCERHVCEAVAVRNRSLLK